MSGSFDFSWLHPGPGKWWQNHDNVEQLASPDTTNTLIILN